MYLTISGNMQNENNGAAQAPLPGLPSPQNPWNGKRSFRYHGKFLLFKVILTLADILSDFFGIVSLFINGEEGDWKYCLASLLFMFLPVLVNFLLLIKVGYSSTRPSEFRLNPEIRSSLWRHLPGLQAYS